MTRRLIIGIGALVSVTASISIYALRKYRSKKPPTITQPQPRPRPPPLEEVKGVSTNEEAEPRAQAIQSPKYLLCLSLGNEEEYNGFVEVKFNVKEKSPSIFLDYIGSQIVAVTINNKPITSTDLFKDNKIEVSKKNQKIGENIVNLNLIDRFIFTSRTGTQKDCVITLILKIRNDIFIHQIMEFLLQVFSLVLINLQLKLL